MSLATLIPPDPHTGQPLNATWGRAVIRCLRALIPTSGAGTLVASSSSGTHYSVRATPRPRRAPEASPATEPDRYLYPKLVTLPNGTPAWSVTAGVLNGSIVPTTATGTLGRDPATGALSTDVTLWAVPIVADGGIWIRATRTESPESLGQGITAATILFYPGEEQPTSTASEGYTILGIITADPTTPGAWSVLSLNSSNLNVAICSGGWGVSSAWNWWNR